VTNLDFVELLLEAGANPNAQAGNYPNAQDHLGWTPLMCTTRDAPGAAKFQLNWPSTDVHITTRFGDSFLARLRGTVEYFPGKVARPDNPDRVRHQFLLRQWREIEEMLAEMGADA
jgi:hypothetical protein